MTHIREWFESTYWSPPALSTKKVTFDNPSEIDTPENDATCFALPLVDPFTVLEL